MVDKIWDRFVEALMALFMPLVCSYFALCSNVFLNTAATDARGLERMGNFFLTPLQYLLAGQQATPQPDGSWEFAQRFDYQNHFWLKTTACALALPPGLILGSAAKGLALLRSAPRHRYRSIFSALRSQKIHSNRPLYETMGIALNPSLQYLVPEGYPRRPGDENLLNRDKKVLQEIGEILNEAGIPWWVDCGTCLGAHRYGGVIPWDEDIDIAILRPDFENVRKALNRLDPKQYFVQDWSSRDFPKSFIKIYLRETQSTLDIYCFDVHPEKNELQFVFSLENHFFFPEWWKIRERRFKIPVSTDAVFPLKKALFDGVEVFVPNDTKKYLQRIYGENLAPAKVYDPLTGCYEKDLNHPYWQRAYVH